MSFAISLASYRVTSAIVSMPARGLWTAHASIDEAKTFAADTRVKLKIGALELDGVKVRGDAFAQTAQHEVIAGRGGWKRTVAARSYGTGNGSVKLSKIIADLARECGEEFTQGFGPSFADRDIGYSHVRFQDTAGRILTSLVGRAWYVGDDGKTVIGDRAVTTKATADVLDFDPDCRIATLNTDTPDKVRPGQTFVANGATFTIDRVVIETGSETSCLAWGRAA